MRYKTLCLISCLLVFYSCSSLKRTVLSGAISGALVGGMGGAVFSPTKADQDKNAYLFGVLGAAALAGLSYLFYDDPTKQKLQAPMIMDEPQTKEIPLFDFSPELQNVKPEVNFKPVKKYEVPLATLPKELEGKVKKQFLIEYEAEARTIEIGNRTIEISPFTAWEHVYEK
ncbi:MAG: hypothetical protein A2X86_13005 [Bdellovibrionales bacterium GWA2_49_15]|nr:MAG: hypothetical protein A2X86_13005 [Bdellovibrionales bacterium GWA2_49_15]HAZ13904.1 hypothetical protein [Bdellovibrionales bacterium]